MPEFTGEENAREICCLKVTRHEPAPARERSTSRMSTAGSSRPKLRSGAKPHAPNTYGMHGLTGGKKGVRAAPAVIVAGGGRKRRVHVPVRVVANVVARWRTKNTMFELVLGGWRRRASIPHGMSDRPKTREEPPAIAPQRSL
jgi:hypothetical protein